ncbi:unnamed protein product [Prunus armeniaca]
MILCPPSLPSTPYNQIYFLLHIPSSSCLLLILDMASPVGYINYFYMRIYHGVVIGCCFSFGSLVDSDAMEEVTLG